jgi:hypothetical protein
MPRFKVLVQASLITSLLLPGGDGLQTLTLERRGINDQGDKQQAQITIIAFHRKLLLYIKLLPWCFR